MSTLSLGIQPHKLNVDLTPGADFITGLDSLDGTWPLGLVVTLVFEDGTEWVATVAGTTIEWNVDKALVDTIIASEARKVDLHYVDGTTDLVWARGQVRVQGDPS